MIQLQKRRDFHSSPQRARNVACLLAILAIGACSPSAPKAAPQASAPPTSQPLSDDVLSQGQAIYEQVCAKCHAAGHGSPVAPSLADSAIVKDSPEVMITSILHGRNGPATINGQVINAVMPPQNSLSNDDIAAAITYVRHQFGHVDQLTTPAEVAAKR